MNKPEIETRLSEIQVILAGEAECDIAALETEVRTLQTEKGEIEVREKRQGIAASLMAGAKEERTIEKGVEGKMEQRVENVFESKEYRTGFLKGLQGKELNDVEQRAMTSVVGSAGPAIPTQTQDEILRKLKQYAPLLAEITLLQVAGNVKFAVEGVIADAAAHAEGATITASNDTLITISLGGYEVNKLVTISKSVSTMSINAFEGWLTDMLSEAIANKITSYILTGTGASEPQGIQTAQTWGVTNSVTEALAATLTAGNVQTLVGLLPGGYDAGAKFVMSKKTLFSDFMPLQDNAKHALVAREGATYYIYGYPVLLEDRVILHEAFLGNLKKAYVGNLAEAVNVVSAFDIKTNSFDYLGSAVFDGKVAIGEGVVKLIKATV